MVQRTLPNAGVFRRGYVETLAQLKIAGVGIQLAVKGIKDPAQVIEQGKTLVEKAQAMPERVDAAVPDELLLEGLVDLLRKKRAMNPGKITWPESSGQPQLKDS